MSCEARPWAIAIGVGIYLGIGLLLFTITELYNRDSKYNDAVDAVPTALISMLGWLPIILVLFPITYVQAKLVKREQDRMLMEQGKKAFVSVEVKR